MTAAATWYHAHPTVVLFIAGSVGLIVVLAIWSILRSLAGRIIGAVGGLLIGTLVHNYVIPAVARWFNR